MPTAEDRPEKFQAPNLNAAPIRPSLGPWFGAEIWSFLELGVWGLVLWCPVFHRNSEEPFFSGFVSFVRAASQAEDKHPKGDPAALSCIHASRETFRCQRHRRSSRHYFR
jgi:hypothetical protein